MTGSNVPWDARYQYLSAGVNTGSGWETWNSPPGQFVAYYLQASAAAGYVPVFSYYELLQSTPSAGADEASRDLSNLANAATMNAYYVNWKLLMTQCAQATGPVVVHVEPDLWGYIEQQVDGASNDASNVPASVASSGNADAAGLPDNAQGFAQALVNMRDRYAPKVVLAIHLSDWGTKADWSSGTTLDIPTLAARGAAFLKTCGSGWNLMFTDVSDRDADYYQLVVGASGHWWQPSDFDRFRQWIGLVNQATGLRCVVWQIPCGNTIMRSCDDTTGHYQDNRPQYFLESYPTNTSISDWARSGVIGLLFGAGATGCTTYDDTMNDGITNPATIPANNSGETATFSDDDGGYLRLRGGSYYKAGKLSLP
jgi:hypothetical protein